jgi:hypothetical protein
LVGCIARRIQPGEGTVGAERPPKHGIFGIERIPGSLVTQVTPIHAYNQGIDRATGQRKASHQKVRRAKCPELSLKRVENLCAIRHVAKALSQRDHARCNCHRNTPAAHLK